MQAILKSKHHRFCSWLQTIKDKQALSDYLLDELENELFAYYNQYMQNREGLRLIIQQYEGKQKNIKNRIKELQKVQYDAKDINTGLVLDLNKYK